MIRFTRTTCLLTLIGLSGFVYACGSSSGGGGAGGAAGTGTGNNAGSNNNNNNNNNGGSNSSNGGSNNSGGSNSSNGGSASGTCDPAADPTGMGADCTAYSECMQENCSSEYEACLGANYQEGDFSGGDCEMYMNCVVDCDCDSTCTQACDLDSACQNCFIGLAFAGCASACSAQLNECAGSQGTGGTSGGGGSSNTGGSGGTGGIPGLSDATCADLAACCPTLDANTQASCDAIVTQGVDLLCAASFTGLGCE
jgi:hypothetical protein